MKASLSQLATVQQADARKAVRIDVGFGRLALGDPDRFTPAASR